MIVGVRIEAGPNNGSHKEEGTNKSEEKKNIITIYAFTLSIVG